MMQPGAAGSTWGRDSQAPIDTKCGRCTKPLSPVWKGHCKHCGAAYAEFTPVPRDPNAWSGPVVPAGPPPPMSDVTRRRAEFATVVGVLCSLPVLVLSFQYALGQATDEPPSVAMGYMIAMAPFLVVGVPLLVYGAATVSKRWSSEYPWLPTASAFLALGWYLMVLGLPSLLSL